MKKFFAVVAMLLFATPLLAQDQTIPADNTAAPADTTAAAPVKAVKKAKAHKAGGDEEGIKKMFDDFTQAWNSGDIDGMASHFTDDATLINPMGMDGHGMAGVKKVFEADFAGPMKGTQQSYDNFNFIWVMNNMALVDTDATVTGMKKPDGTNAGPMKIHVYGVIVNRGKGWKARAIRAYAYLQPTTDASTAAAPADASTTPVADKAAPAKDTNSKSDATK